MFDTARDVLVLELLPGFENLWELHFRRRRFVPRLAAQLGRKLGQLHADPRKKHHSFDQGLGRPLVFELLNPTKAFIEECSDANLKLIQIVQSNATLSSHLVSAETLWRQSFDAAESFIHGDVRFQNCCVALHPDKLRIVDWEFSGRGDPTWDIGCVFAGFLSSWIDSIPMPAGAEPGQCLVSSSPLLSMKEAARSFWFSYMTFNRQAQSDGINLLRRSIVYAAARLIQLAFEKLQNAWTITMHTISNLQLSQNLFERPVEGGIHLLGIPG
jgi:hypothetical protein